MWCNFFRCAKTLKCSRKYFKLKCAAIFYQICVPLAQSGWSRQNFLIWHKVILIFRRNADPNLCDKYGVSCLDVAKTSSKSKKLVQVLMLFSFMLHFVNSNLQRQPDNFFSFCANFSYQCNFLKMKLKLSNNVNLDFKSRSWPGNKISSSLLPQSAGLGQTTMSTPSTYCT